MLKTAFDSIVHTISKQCLAVANFTNEVENSEFFQYNAEISLECMYSSIARRGKIVVCGVGKSFKIADKLQATMNSLSIHAASLHPTDALHGDLGVLRDEDTLIFVTASGNTPELIQLLPHISKKISIVLLTCSKQSKLATHPRVKSLLYAALPKDLNEDSIHGLPAPTVSATLSLILGDAIILALSEMLEQSTTKRKKQFSERHPGGSIGADLSSLNYNIKQADKTCSAPDSYSSLLSLSEISKHFDGDSSSDPESSVDSKPEYAHLLSYKIESCDPSKVFLITCDDLDIGLGITEIGYLKWIVLYDYLIIRDADTLKALSTNRARELYAENLHKTSSDWATFLPLLVKEFRPVELKNKDI